MAATLTSRPPAAAFVAVAALLAVLALAAAPASASHLNYYRGKGCTGGIMATCYDGQRCGVPNGASSYQFLYLEGWSAYLFNNPTCAGSSNGVISSDLRCRDGISFQCVKITNTPPSVLEMATDQA